jgi:hypothetical protein
MLRQYMVALPRQKNMSRPVLYKRCRSQKILLCVHLYMRTATLPYPHSTE